MNVETSDHDTPAQNQLKDFIIWVDGVGGYLVCCGHKNLLGQAIPDSDVTIPLRGDVSRQHAMIETVEDRHLLHPFGPVCIDDRPLNEAAVLIHDQIFQMGDAVAIGYRKPHPLSSTAVLDFVSRHRTLPWSDAVLLAGDTIVLGSQTRNHVVCPHWKHEMILYRRTSGWCVKTKAAGSIDGHPLKNQTLQDKSYITGENYSFSIEAI